MTLPQEKAPVRILLADDHEVIRRGTGTYLRLHLGCEICAETPDGREALKLVESTAPDVAVVDLALPGLNGLELTRQIRRLSPGTEVVILTGDVSADLTQRAFEAGAKACILKVDAVTQLAEAVRTVADHRFFLTPQGHQSFHVQKSGQTGPSPTDEPIPLTSREGEIVQLLAEGKSNKEIATLLGISVKTVETHRATIMRKLKFTNLSDLVRYAIRHKIIHA